MTQHALPGRADAVRALSHLLEVGDEADRCYACRALGVISNGKTAESLIARLRDEDIDVCIDAAQALGRLRARAAVPALLDALAQEPDGEVKTAVVEALGQIGGRDVVPALLEVAAHRPDALEMDAGSDWDPWWDIQREAVIALGRLGAPEAVPVFAQILADEDGQDIEAEVISAMACAGDEGGAALLERLRTGSPRTRRRAATALGSTGSKTAARALGQALKDPEALVRAAAVEALAEAGAGAYLKAVILLQRDPDPNVRVAATRAASRLAAQEAAADTALTTLTPLLDDASPAVRRVVLEHLGTRADALDPALLARVEATLADTDTSVTAAACALLASGGGERGREALRRAASDPEVQLVTSAEALRALGRSGTWNEALAETFTAAIVSSEQPVRLAALRALADLRESSPHGSGEATPGAILVAALRGDLVPVAEPHDVPEPADDASALDSRDAGEHDRSPDGPTSTLEAIAWDNAEVAEQIAEDAEDPAAAAPLDDVEEYLAIVDRQARDAERLFPDRNIAVDQDVRCHAARVLAQANDAASIGALIAALGEADDTLRLEAAKALSVIAQRGPTAPGLVNAFGPLMTQLHTGGEDLRIACIRALGALGNPEAAPAIEPSLTDPEPALRGAAIDALVALGSAVRPSTPLAKSLLGALTDPEPGVRIAAARGLVALARRADASAPATEVVVDAVISAGFAGAGDQARDMARALRELGGDHAVRRLLFILDTLPTSAERRFAIAMLEEIFISTQELA